ncbi:MAG TPA: hypothetical protein VJ417_00990, partial [Candidatus Glassbacteria bacterium]|nr:hypothetical protein [Candidatus Glassbacteria bacterium]
MTKQAILTLVVLVLAALAGRASAACEPQWLQGQAVPGVDGTVYAMASWDPDEAGPQAGLIFVGGSFSLAGNVAANNIACWDPVTSTWSALGSGVDNWVYALAVLDGKLYASGNFTTAGGANAAGIA